MDKHLHIADCVKNHDLDLVAITESGRRDFPMHTLDHLSGGIEFIWKWIPPRDRSGGILHGVRASALELPDFSNGEFHIKFHLRNKSDNFIWRLVAVYGATQDEHNADFLRELVNLPKDNPYPILIGGDFIIS